MTVERVGCMVRVCTCHDDHAWTYTGSYPEGCSSCGCRRAPSEERRLVCSWCELPVAEDREAVTDCGLTLCGVCLVLLRRQGFRLLEGGRTAEAEREA